MLFIIAEVNKLYCQKKKNFQTVISITIFLPSKKVFFDMCNFAQYTVHLSHYSPILILRSKNVYVRTKT